MFDKWKASKQYQQVKNHLVKHKEAYIVGAGCLVVGYTIGFRGSMKVTNAVAPVFNNTTEISPSIAPVISPVFNNVVNNLGHMRKIVLCIETGERWGSVTDSAVAQGVSIARMSQHLNEHRDNINGLHFIIEALATAA